MNYYKQTLKYFHFLFIGGINALIYSIILYISIMIINNYYSSLVLSQVIIIFIAYANFSKYFYSQAYKISKFVKFILSNCFILCISFLIAFVSNYYNFTDILFVFINILIIAPISYLINTLFVFREGQNEIK